MCVHQEGWQAVHRMGRSVSRNAQCSSRDSILTGPIGERADGCISIASTTWLGRSSRSGAAEQSLREGKSNRLKCHKLIIPG